MANPIPQPLHLVGFDGMDDFTLADDQWLALESKLDEGRTLNAEEREKLLKICNEYQFARLAEINVVPFKELEKRFKVTKRITDRFWYFAGDVEKGSNDVSSVLQALYEFELQKIPVPAEDGVFKLDFDTLMHIAIALKVASKKVEVEIARLKKTGAGNSGFRRGNAFKDFVLQLYKWAKNSGFRHNHKKFDETPSSFTEFVFELHGFFDATIKYNHPENSDQMMHRIHKLKPSRTWGNKSS